MLQSATSFAQIQSIPLPSPRRSREIFPQELAESYREIFDSIIADTDALREKTHRLRYQVYCIENTGFENPDEHPDGKEMDVYDNHSVHGVLLHRPTGLAIGAVRMIMPVVESAGDSFPMQALCWDSRLHHRKTIMQSLEVSRFCISRSMRKSICHPHTYLSFPDTNYSSIERSPLEMAAETRALLPYLSLGLIKLPLQVAAEDGLPYIFATLDPRLLQLLTQLGVCSQRIGEDIDHHGIRTPVLFVPLDIFENTYRNKRDVWKIITDNGRLHDLAALQSR